MSEPGWTEYRTYVDRGGDAHSVAVWVTPIKADAITSTRIGLDAIVLNAGRQERGLT